MAGIFFVGAAFAAGLIGLVSLLRPLALVGIRTRRRALGAIGVSALLGLIGTLLPAGEIRVAVAEAQLDAFAPIYQFNEVHSIRVNATAERVFRSIKAVTAEEIWLFRTLTWIRRFGRPGPEGILRAPERQPLLDVVTRTSFLLLAEEPGKEVVIGTIVIAPHWSRPASRADPAAFRALDQPGFAKAVMNFHIRSDGSGGCVLKTETRVFATDPSTKRRFAGYWRVIYPGSSLIRFMWLRAIKRRAELTPGGLVP